MSLTLKSFFDTANFDFAHVQFINVETATVGISGVRFTPKCESCADYEEISFECKGCNISNSSFAQVRSGDGDGLYPVFECMNGHGVAVFFDQNSQYAQDHADWISGKNSGVDHSLSALLSPDLENASVLRIGTIRGSTRSNVMEYSATLVALADAMADDKDAVAVGVAGQGEDVGLFVILGPRDGNTHKELVPRILIAVGLESLPKSLISSNSPIDEIHPSAGKEWFQFPVKGALAGGRRENAYFQTAIHCQEIAEIIYKDGQNAELMGAWVARGLSCLEKLEQLHTDLSIQLLAKIDKEFLGGTYKSWWTGETEFLLKKLGKPKSFFEAQILEESWFRTLGTSPSSSAGESVQISEKAVDKSQRPKFCPNCGNPVAAAGAFCAHCGNKL
jgi:hypothetical protein